MANGSRHSMRYVVESTYGTTPSTPTLTPIRHTGTSLGLSKDTLQSEEIRSDRQIVDFRHGTRQVGGDINVELSYGSSDDILEAVLMGTWANETPASGTDQLKVGTTRRSFTIERQFEDLSSGNPFFVYTGCEFSALNVSVNTAAIVSATLTVVGKNQTTSATEISGATVSAASTTTPFDGFSGAINEGGSTIAVVTSIDFTLDNAHNTKFVIGSNTTLQPSVGRSNVSGNVTAYFEDTTLLDKFISETDSSLDFTLVDLAGNQYKFYFPNIKYLGGQPDVSGEGPITISMPFQAVYDETSETNFYIERTPA